MDLEDKLDAHLNTCCNTCYSQKKVFTEIKKPTWKEPGGKSCTHTMLSHDYLLAHASYCLMSRLLSWRLKKDLKKIILDCALLELSWSYATFWQETRIYPFLLKLWASSASSLDGITYGLIVGIRTKYHTHYFWSLSLGTHRNGLSKLVWY
jgi:hypothetical protein